MHTMSDSVNRQPTAGSLRRRLGRFKGAVAEALKDLLVGSPLPLDVQAWAIKRLLPMDPWPKSLAYQQCLADRVIRKLGGVTQSGPFKGMVCLGDAEEGCLVPKLFGCYEEELIPTFERFFDDGFDRFIDVGCASGYWLAGVATRMPAAECFGFDGSSEALQRCARLLALNNLQARVKLFGLCKASDLEALIRGRTLVLMDVDGPEYDLLDPEKSPALRRAEIIVECHDYLDPRILPTLMRRFGTSHTIERISSRLRQPDPQVYPGLKALPPSHWNEALHERRPATQEWLVMRSKG
jgi:hypothetical protein